MYSGVLYPNRLLLSFNFPIQVSGSTPGLLICKFKQRPCFFRERECEGGAVSERSGGPLGRSFNGVKSTEVVAAWPTLLLRELQPWGW